MIREYGQLLSEEYREDGIFVQAKIPAEFFECYAPGLIVTGALYFGCPG